MFGLRPSTTGFYDNRPNGAEQKAFTNEHTSMPRHFRANGYTTLTTGKIYHGSKLPENDFMVVGPRFDQWIDLDEVIQKDKPEHMHRIFDFGPQSYDEKKFIDYIDASWAIEQLGKTYDQPFFLAVGFYRPHTPFFSPERVYNNPDLMDGFMLPVVKNDDLNDISEHAQKMIYNPNPPNHKWMQENNNQKWKEAVHSYLACIRWADEQIGRLLDALDNSAHAKNTIIVFYGDHGFHMGEKEHWAKWTLWERSTRIPFIISVPGGLKGVACSKPVELLSIYPTLIDLCNLTDNDELDGVSVQPLLEKPKRKWNHAAITTLYKHNHSIKTERWRFIQYASGDEELYDHKSDPNEWENLAGNPDFKRIIEKLRTYLPEINAEQYKKP